MCYRLVQCMLEGLEPDIDVYDAAAWSVPGPLSEVHRQCAAHEVSRLHTRMAALHAFR